jgi:hypothetical protein
MRLLYLIPETAVDPALAFHGSTKDALCLSEYFHSRGMAVTQIPVGRSNVAILGRLAAVDLTAFDAIVLSLPGCYPRMLQQLRAASPGALIVFRSHNAEFLHRLDWMAAASGVRAKLEYAQRSARALLRDLVTVRWAAHYVLPISEADARSYWRRLGGSRRVVTVPYFNPGPPPSRSLTAKTDLCVCLTAVKSNPLVADAARNFFRLVGQLDAALPHWRFAITGESGTSPPLPPRVESWGILSSPFDALEHAKAVAVLSDYGRGFKTKILEAVQARCWVLVTPRLFARLPPQVQPFCFRVRGNRVDDLVQALQRCDERPPLRDVNAELREQAFAALDRVFERGRSVALK